MNAEKKERKDKYSNTPEFSEGWVDENTYITSGGNGVPDRPYYWKVTFDTGKTAIVGSEDKKFPRGTAQRMATMKGWGMVTSSELIPEQALKRKRQQKVFPSYIPPVTRYSEDLSRMREEYFATHDRDKQSAKEQELLKEALVEQLVTPLLEKSVDVELKDPDETADDELVNYISSVKDALKQAGMTLATVNKALDRFFDMIAEADPNDPDVAEEFAMIARLHRKKFSRFDDSINEADCAFEKIIENLEGA